MQYVAKVRTHATNMRTGRRTVLNAGTLHCESLTHARAIQRALETVTFGDEMTGHAIETRVPVFVRVFVEGVGRVDIPPSSIRHAAKSLRELADEMSEDTDFIEMEREFRSVMSQD